RLVQAELGDRARALRSFFRSNSPNRSIVRGFVQARGHRAPASWTAGGVTSHQGSALRRPHYRRRRGRGRGGAGQQFTAGGSGGQAVAVAMNGEGAASPGGGPGVTHTPVAGVLEVLQDGNGYLRSASRNYLAHPLDPFVPQSMVRQLRMSE